MNRRAFLGSIAVAVGSNQLGCMPHSSAASSGSRRLKRVGVQLYSLRDDARRDLERTLASIADIGYRDVELLGSLDNFGMPPARLRQVLDQNDLRAPSTH
ncbi:MAG: sugar phosphate isomerase/epimerase, partial [Gemmatimonadaceae bacterium]